jgi:hypothetical protein
MHMPGINMLSNCELRAIKARSLKPQAVVNCNPTGSAVVMG